MLEDYTMEKKTTGRSAQVPGKSNGTEQKKSQDVVNSKPFPRSYRRRESNGSFTSKFEPNKKPQKSSYKRPRPRGQYYGSGKENTKIANTFIPVEDETEYGSVLVQGRKKQNLNHLLNFHYAPRESAVPGWRLRDSQGSARWLASSTHKHKYNKEQFLQANCQFVVKADGDYTSCKSDPDTLVNWDLIEQIRLQSSEMLSCPICLYQPVAAKMTRCGHVYCWSCILHYLALSDKTWRKCPICYEAVHKEDLRSVIAVPHIQLSVGEEVTMRLMKRERGSLMALPVYQCGIRPADVLLSISETAVDTVHSKLLLATPKEVMSIVDHEKEELQKQLSEDEDCPETCFIEQAINLLAERHEVLSRQVTDTSGEQQQFEMEHTETVATESKPDLIYESAFDNEIYSEEISCMPDDTHSEFAFGETLPTSCDELSKRQRYESVSSEGLGSDDGNTNITVEDLEIPTMVSSAEHAGTPTNKYFYFYQAEDGQHIYLHALNARMLEHSYGSLENCPPILKGHIIEKESGSMTEELRRRLRYLQHLPVTCQFEVAEINLKPPVITKQTLVHFQDQLKLRQIKRQRRARNERLREKKINEEENRRWGHYPTPHIRIESHRHFPECGIESETSLISVSASPVGSSASLVSSRTSSHDSIPSIAVSIGNLQLNCSENTEDLNMSVDPQESSGMSFAQMLREGKSKSSDWPNMNKNRSSTRPMERHQNLNSESEQEKYLSAPTFNQSLGDAIAVALEKAEAVKKLPEGETESSFGKKKKKKQKQKILFATGMTCSAK